MFNLEQEEYAREQIPWTKINFDKDSSATIDLISKIFSALEDMGAAVRGGANPDKDFTSKLTQQFGGRHPKFARRQVAGDYEFSLKHYAGTVTYDTQEWIDKNRDPLEADLQTIICSSGSKTLAKLFADFALNTAAMTEAERNRASAARGPKGGSLQTISSAYKDQLNSLIITLQSTQPHFIRCIIPNHQKRPHAINDALVIEQLNCNGVLEGIRISRLGYPNRMLYADFVKRYFIIDGEATKNMTDKRAATEKILNKCVGKGLIDPQRHAFGKTKIFFRVGELSNIEDERARVVGQMVGVIQALARGYAGRKTYIKLKEKYTAAGVICDSVRDWLSFREWAWWKLFTRVRPHLKIFNYEAQLKQIQDKTNAINKEIQSARDAATAAEEKVEELELTINNLKNEIQESQRAYSDLRSQYDNAESEKRRLAAKLAELDSSVEAAESSVGSQDAQRNSLSKQIKELEDQRFEVEGDLANLQRLCKGNSDKLSGLQTDYDRIKDENNTSRAQAMRLEDELHDAESAHQMKQTQQDALDRQKKKLTDDIRDAQEDVEDLALDNKKLNEQLSKLTSELKDAQSALEDERNRNGAEGQQAVRLKSELDDFTGQLENENKNKANLEKNKRTLESQLKETQNKLEDAQRTKADLQKKLNKTQSDLKDAQEALEDEQAERDGLETAKGKLDALLAQLTRELQEANAALAKLKGERCS